MEKSPKEMVQEIFIGMRINAQAWGDMTDLVMLRTAIKAVREFSKEYDNEVARQSGAQPTIADPTDQSIHQN